MSEQVNYTETCVWRDILPQIPREIGFVSSSRQLTARTIFPAKISVSLLLYNQSILNALGTFLTVIFKTPSYLSLILVAGYLGVILYVPMVHVLRGTKFVLKLRYLHYNVYSYRKHHGGKTIVAYTLKQAGILQTCTFIQSTLRILQA